MYPLLVNAIASTAGNLIDRWAQSSASKASASSVSFQKMLESAATPQRTAASNLATALEQLKRQLLASPEVRTAMDSSDPTRPVSLQISQDGTVSTQSAGQAARPLSLSPDTAMLARSLATMLPANSTL